MIKKSKKSFKKNKKPKIPSLNLEQKTRKEIWGIILIFLALFFAFALIGLEENEGKFIDTISRILILFFGFGSWIITISTFVLGVSFITTKETPVSFQGVFGGILFTVSFFAFLGLISEDSGGAFGEILIYAPISLVGTPVTWIFFGAMFLISLCVLFNIRVSEIFKKGKISSPFKKMEGDIDRAEKSVKLKEGEAKFRIKNIIPGKEEKYKDENRGGEKEDAEKDGIEDPHITKKLNKEIQYKSLPLTLLSKGENGAVAGNLRANAQIIKRTFKNFGIEVEMGEINIGPTVTQYTLKPAEGIRLSKITSLQGDLCLALASPSIRVEAPIPGKSLVGIEVPNQKRAGIRLSQLLSSPEFPSLSPLSFPIGKDVMGNPYFTDIEKMPHLLVAGTTGAGKTVFLNSLLLSLLWRNSPEHLRFILIDPKRVEFTPYASLPHLLCPPITNHQKVIPALKWLIGEMEARFILLQGAKKRDIRSYNHMVGKQEAKEKDGSQKVFIDEENEIEKLPYIILMIDELADIMVAKGKEFEAGIVRLAQMSRAVGIHLVLATQRPSVEVLTGLIKINISSRIALKVFSQVDSRTILDQAGADKLLGSGDMLFMAGDAAKPRRIQSAYISSGEIKRVVDYIEKNENKAEGQKEMEDNLEETLEHAAENNDAGFDGGEYGGDDDVMYERAKEIVIQAKKASASFLQRRLKVGYARAARLLDMLEKSGIVGPANGSKPREVYGDSGVDDNEIGQDNTKALNNF